MSANEVYHEIAADLPFYVRSNGGVTLSGGEPLAQSEFTMELLRVCALNGIHTAIETCGYYPWEHLQQCLPFLQLVFFDLKHMDPERHKDLTGQDNRLILDNAVKLFRTDIPVVVRFPVVPGYNNDIANLKAMVGFLREYPRIEVELLPYHPLGTSKCRGLRTQAGNTRFKSPTQESLQRIRTLFEKHGIACRFNSPA